MNIDRNGWKLESISSEYVMIIRKEHGDQRIVTRASLPSIATLQALSDLDFDRAAVAAFLGWDVPEQKPPLLARIKQAVAGLLS